MGENKQLHVGGCLRGYKIFLQQNGNITGKKKIINTYTSTKEFTSNENENTIIIKQ